MQIQDAVAARGHLRVVCRHHQGAAAGDHIEDRHHDELKPDQRPARAKSSASRAKGSQASLDSG